MGKKITALAKACVLAGGQKALADRIGTSQGHVWFWLNKSKSKRVPAEYALTIERATGVSRSELRPDLWPVKERTE